MFRDITSKVGQGMKWLFATTKESWEAAGPPIEPEGPLETSLVAIVPEQAESSAAPPNVIQFPGKRPCTVEGCERPHHARGLCSSHYSQARRAKAA